MSSQVKVEPTLVPKVVKGESFLTQIGVARFQWTIKNFNDVSNCFKAIQSSSFSVDIIDPSTKAKKVQSYHVEMEFTNNKPPFPVYLVQETGEKSLSTKISLIGNYKRDEVMLEKVHIFLLSANNKKKFMNVTPQKNLISFPEEVTFEIQVTLNQLISLTAFSN
jgi:hypothetical protein